MKVLFQGCHGWIGQQLLTVLDSRNIRVVEGTSRADDEKAVCNEIDTVRPTHVLCTLGRTHGTLDDGTHVNTIDYLEAPGKLFENVRDNLQAPVFLALACKERNIHCTYLGTGCIFETTSEKGLTSEKPVFDVDDKPNFYGSAYSIVKGFTDRIMHLLDKSVLNARIRMPITKEPNERDFVTKITKYSHICSMPNSMTYLDEMLPKLVDCMQEHKTGTVHLIQEGTLDHETILEMYKTLVDPLHTQTLMSIEEQNQILKSKRSNNELTPFPGSKHLRDVIQEVLEYRKAI